MLKKPAIDLVLRDMGHVLDCFLKLSITIANPAQHDQPDYEQQDIRLVIDRFPLLDYRLVERL